MARANLQVEEELSKQFVKASKDSVRWIKAELRDVNICFLDKAAVRGSAEDDLETMKEGALVGSGPCFVLFCLTPDSDRNGWVLIAFVPDNSKVRARMLYASGQEDVKRALGHSNFVSSVHITDVEDLTMDAIRGTVRRNLEDAPLTEEELLAKEEVAQMAAPSEARANAMGMIPFNFHEKLDSQIKAFISESCDFVEAKVMDNENVGLGDTRADKLSNATVVKDEPRFYLIRQPSGKVYFVFSCPEGTKIRTRMLYSTCKQTMLHHIAELGVEVDKQIEVGDPGDVDDLLKLHDTPDDNQGKIVQQNFSKPSRPGRGKARIVKQ